MHLSKGSENCLQWLLLVESPGSFTALDGAFGAMATDFRSVVTLEMVVSNPDDEVDGAKDFGFNEIEDVFMMRHSCCRNSQSLLDIDAVPRTNGNRECLSRVF
jgi:hypothetical protein